MDLQELETLVKGLQETINSMPEQFNASINKAINGYDARLQKDVLPKLVTSTDGANPDVDKEQPTSELTVLQKRYADLEQRFNDKEKAELNSRVNTELFRQAKGIDDTTGFVDYFSYSLDKDGKEVYEEGGKYYVKSGDAVSELSEELSKFKTDHGAKFMTPTVKTKEQTKETSPSEKGDDVLNSLQSELGF